MHPHADPSDSLDWPYQQIRIPYGYCRSYQARHTQSHNILVLPSMISGIRMAELHQEPSTACPTTKSCGIIPHFAKKSAPKSFVHITIDIDKDQRAGWQVETAPTLH